MKSYVLGFAFDETLKRVALIVKARPAWQKDKLNGLGGKIEEGETPLQAMTREFREEAGVSTTESEWNLFSVLEGPDFKVYVMRAQIDEARFSRLHSCTDETVVDMPLDNPALVRHALSNVPWLIAAAQDGDCGRMVITARYGTQGQDLGEQLINEFQPA
jgi:8-oxo-dGTP diphosphatase